CPTAAAACSSLISCGRVVQPRRFMPSAIAPLDTMITSRPSRASAASCRDHSPIAPSSRPRPSSVTRLEPTFTTMRFASRRTGDEAASDILETGIDFLRRLGCHLDGTDVLVDRLRERLGAFARQGRDLEHRPLVLEALD